MDNNSIFGNHRQSTSGNLCSQLLERERKQQSDSKVFAAKLFRDRYRLAKNLYKTDLCGHYGCVNAIEFSHGGRYLASGGDDKRVLIWDVEKSIGGVGRPRVLDTEHMSNIFCLGFDSKNNKVFSGGNDDLVIVHDFETGKPSNVFKHDNPVYGLSIDPQCDNIFATACEDGQVLVFDQRVDPAEPLVLAHLQHSSFHAVEFHPAGGHFLVTANSKRGAAFWDIRKPHHPLIQYGHLNEESSYMSVRFNSNGKLILALRRRLPPILYSTQSPEPICTFYHNKYYNSCTMKGCIFAGEDDEFVLSGSDDFNLYVWRISDVNLERTNQWIETTQMVLYGHRSIVNQVRYNRQKCLLASSGVEKIVKLWSPFAQKDWTGSLLQSANCSDNPRELYSPYNFNTISAPPHSWGNMSHDYSSCNTGEDPRMMAFFDSLIQQEIEGWESENSSTDSLSTNDVSDAGEENGGNEMQSSTSSSNEDNQDRDSSESSDNRNDNNSNRGVIHRRYNAHLYATRRNERKRIAKHMKQTNRERNKHANRIAYLISTKRNRLRRLAIKGATLSNRCLCKVVKATNRKPQTSGQLASGALLQKRLNDSSCSATTSAAAAAASSSTSTSTAGQRNNIIHKCKRRHVKTSNVLNSSSDSSDDERHTLSTNIKSNSNNFKANVTLLNNTDIVVASTSNGITSNLATENIVRLQHQQQQKPQQQQQQQTPQQQQQRPDLQKLIDTKKDEENEEQNNSKMADSDRNDGEEKEEQQQQHQQQQQKQTKRSNHTNGKLNAMRPASGSTNVTMLPQQTTTTTIISKNNTHNNNNIINNNNNNNSNNNNSNNNNNNNNNNNITNNNSNINNDSEGPHNNNSTICRRRSMLADANIDNQQQQEQHQQSQYVTPVKRRKTETDTQNCIEHQTTPNDDGSTQSISNNNSNNHNNNHNYNYNNNKNYNNSNSNSINNTVDASILHTPDSGISMSSATPTSPQPPSLLNINGNGVAHSSGCSYANNHNSNDTATAGTTTTNGNQSNYARCTNGDESDNVGCRGDNNDGICELSGNIRNGCKTHTAFQQKMARVRRSYRKHFVEDSDSD